jgi:hypothetical protein
MAKHELSLGQTDEWYTPRYVFEAMGARFDLDVAAPRAEIPADDFCTSAIVANSLAHPWRGFVWMNPPFGGRNSLKPWLDKFFAHGNGIALTPDRTSAPWWQEAARRADAVLFIAGKVRFIRPDGSEGKSPSNGTTLFAAGYLGVLALDNARKQGLGYMPPPDLNKLQSRVAA